jgi:uncharacterized protein YecE (DUF72 family)
MKWYIGCSGFHYNDWKNIFYPEGLAQKNWFSFYCEHFNTLELNVTFYNFPKITMLKNWYAKSPEGFLFSVKAPRLITHYKKFTESKSLLADFYHTVGNGLQEKAGAMLFQLPASIVYSEEKLTQIVTCMDSQFQNVVEFRHASWWNAHVYKEFKKAKISFCNISHPDLKNIPVNTAPYFYFRFHGVPELYQSLYKKTELQIIVETIQGYKNMKQAYIYFNNTAGGSAIQNAKEIQELLNPSS